jgi:hypothetical protein
MARAKQNDIVKVETTELAENQEPVVLNEEQTLLLERVEHEINDAYEGQRLHFLDKVGSIIVKHLWGGDVAKANLEDPVLKALFDSKGVKCSQPNLWYAVRLQTNPEEVFGQTWQSLSVSHRKRLLHVADDKRRRELADRVKEKNLSVKDLEDAINANKHGDDDPSKRGPKKLPPAAKHFYSVGKSFTELLNTDATKLDGLTPKRADELLGQVEELRKLVTDWLPLFEEGLQARKRAGSTENAEG